MDPRGLTTLAIGAALMLSPFAIWLTSDPDPVAAEVAAAVEPAAPAKQTVEQTVAQGDATAEPGCTAAAIVSTSGRTDCNGETTKVTSRRVMSGGAVFVQVGD